MTERLSISDPLGGIAAPLRTLRAPSAHSHLLRGPACLVLSIFREAHAARGLGPFERNTVFICNNENLCAGSGCHQFFVERCSGIFLFMGRGK